MVVSVGVIAGGCVGFYLVDWIKVNKLGVSRDDERERRLRKKVSLDRERLLKTYMEPNGPSDDKNAASGTSPLPQSQQLDPNRSAVKDSQSTRR
jgi:hypothetical protein